MKKNEENNCHSKKKYQIKFSTLKIFTLKNFPLLLFLIIFQLLHIPPCNNLPSQLNSSLLESYLSLIDARFIFNNVDIKNITSKIIYDYENTTYSTKKIQAQKICSDYKKLLKENNFNYKNIKSIFPSIIEKIRSQINNTASTANYYDWLNTTNGLDSFINETEVTEPQNYTISNIYLAFPIITVLILIFIYVTIFNCLYCNFCYCCCFSYTKIFRENKNYFNTMIFFIVILCILLIGLAGIGQMRTNAMSKYSSYIFCEALNKNVLIFISNKDYSILEEPEELNNTKGLIELRNNFNSEYMGDLQNIGKQIGSYEAVGNIDPMYKEIKEIKDGLVEFKEYIKKNSFDYTDEMDHNVTYVCEKCKSLGNETESITNRVYTEYYKDWYDTLNSTNYYLYNQIKSKDGWESVMIHHNLILEIMNKLSFLGENFLSRIIEKYDSYTSFFNSFANASFVMLIICLFLIFGGIHITNFAYFRIFILIFNRKNKQQD